MARFLLFLGVFVLSATCMALDAVDFRIKTLRETHSADTILVGRNWLKDPKRLLVTLRVESDTPASSIFVRAYFFDKDGKQVSKYEQPNPVWMQTPRGFEEVGLPSMLAKNKDIDVYFAVTQELDAMKWKSVVVVFGNDTVVAARSFPTTALNTLEFPEKARVRKDQN